MKVTTKIDKLRILLPHWIEHNRSHRAEFEKWAAVAGEEGLGEAASLIEKAVNRIREADGALSLALDKIGGPLPHEHHH